MQIILMKYRLGYDYYWNFKNPFKYKDKVVHGANLNVLFFPVFECTQEEYDEKGFFPDQKYQGVYLQNCFTPKFDKENRCFDFVPTKEARKLKGPVSFTIVDYELDVAGEPDKVLPPELKDIVFMDPFKVTEEEFMDIFAAHEFTDLQSTAYFGKEVGDVVYFELNNWFAGKHYPAEEPFLHWMNDDQYIAFMNETWVKENKLCVKFSIVDMSFNFCITASRDWVEKDCPKLFTDYQEFIRLPSENGKVFGRFGDEFVEYKEKISEFYKKEHK